MNKILDLCDKIEGENNVGPNETKNKKDILEQFISKYKLDDQIASIEKKKINYLKRHHFIITFFIVILSAVLLLDSEIEIWGIDGICIIPLLILFFLIILAIVIYLSIKKNSVSLKDVIYHEIARSIEEYRQNNIKESFDYLKKATTDLIRSNMNISDRIISNLIDYVNKLSNSKNFTNNYKNTYADLIDNIVYYLIYREGEDLEEIINEIEIKKPSKFEVVNNIFKGLKSSNYFYPLVFTTIVTVGAFVVHTYITQRYSFLIIPVISLFLTLYFQFNLERKD